MGDQRGRAMARHRSATRSRTPTRHPPSCNRASPTGHRGNAFRHRAPRRELTAQNASTPAGARTVREAEVTDAAAIAALGSEAFRATHIGLLDVRTIDAVIVQTYSVPALTACIAQCAGAPDAFFLVACAESSILGYLHYDNTGDEPELHRIYVTRHKEGTGIGTALLEALHARLPDRASYRVTVAAGNEPALRFYRRRGFTTE